MGKNGQEFGLARVLEPEGVLPQAAWRLDPLAPLGEDEVLLSVERLNLDAASYRQLREEHGGDGLAVREAVRSIVEERARCTIRDRSGGMLIAP